MDKDICTPSKLNQIFGNPGISRQYNRVTTKINPVSKSRFYRAMINQECRHLDPFLIENNTLADIMAQYFDTVTGCFFIYVATHVNIKGKRLLNMIHHINSAGWAPNLKWDLTSTA